MIVWSTLEASCPICQTRTRLRDVGSGFIVGQDSDLLVRMTSKHIIQAEIHTCPRCRFSGFVGDFLRTLTPLQSQRFRDEVSPSLDDEAGVDLAASERKFKTPLPHVQYQWAARAAQGLGLSAAEEGERWLRAYWCLRLAPSSCLAPAVQKALKKLYLKWAISKLRQALSAERDANRVYLIGELCRRNGNFSMAVSHFERFLARQDGAAYLQVAARRLIAASQGRLSNDFTMEEVLYGRETDQRSRGPSRSN